MAKKKHRSPPFSGVVDDDDMDALLNWTDTAKREFRGGTRYPGQTYEDGIRDMVDWLTGNGDRPDQKI